MPLTGRCSEGLGAFWFQTLACCLFLCFPRRNCRVSSCWELKQVSSRLCRHHSVWQRRGTGRPNAISRHEIFGGERGVNLPVFSRLQGLATTTEYNIIMEITYSRSGGVWWSAKQGKWTFLPGARSRLRVWSREMDLSVPSRVSLLILHYSDWIWWCLLLTEFLPLSVAAFIYLFKTAISVPSLSGHAIAYRWRSLQKVCRYRASSPHGSSGNGCCLFRHHRGPINVRLSFPTPTHYWILRCVCEP